MSEDKMREALANLRTAIYNFGGHGYPAQKREPIEMLLFCPKCQRQHVDAPEPETGWTNPPHATHTCKFCGLNWRPSNALTTGVVVIDCLEPKHAERIAACIPVALVASPPEKREPVAVESALRLGDQLADWINAAGPALRELLGAYERRVRSLCLNQDELDKRPWECMEFIAAKRVLDAKPVAVVEISAPPAEAKKGT